VIGQEEAEKGLEILEAAISQVTDSEESYG